MTDTNQPASAPSGLAVPPFMTFKDAAAAIAFGAEEEFRLTGADGSGVAHAEMRFGSTAILMSDEAPDFGALSPATLDGSPVKLFLRGDDVDEVTDRTEAAGTTILRKHKDEFSGECTAMVSAPFGYAWFLSAPIKEVIPAEMQEH